MNHVEDLTDLVRRQNLDFLSRFPKVMVACSGGVDSISLFSVLWDLKKRKKISDLALGHVNFCLRGDDSDGDELFLYDQCRAKGVPFYLKRTAPHEGAGHPGESIQEWARRIRYEFFEEKIKEGWIIALAHHQDDLAENVLLRLARGSSCGALAGMSQLHGAYWRPFLGITKSQIQTWAKGHNLPHREDASNAKMDYSRNLIRHRILPELDRLFPGASARIVRLAKEAGDLEGFCAERLEEELKISTAPGAGIDLNGLCQFGDGVIKSALVKIIGQGDCMQRTLTSSLLDQAVGFVRTKVGRASITVPGGGLLAFRSGTVNFMPKAKAGSLGKHRATLAQLSTSVIVGPNSVLEQELSWGHQGVSYSLANEESTAQQLIITAAAQDGLDPRLICLKSDTYMAGKAGQGKPRGEDGDAMTERQQQQTPRLLMKKLSNSGMVAKTIKQEIGDMQPRED